MSKNVDHSTVQQREAERAYSFEALADDNLRPGSVGAALTFCFLLLGQLASYPRALPFPWAGVALAAAALTVAARAAYSKERKKPRHAGANVAEAGVALATLIHGLAVIVANGSIDHTTHILLLIIAAGCVMLSPLWLGIVITSAAAGWAAVVLLILPPDGQWQHFAYAFALAGLLSIVIFITRVRTVERLEAARRGEHDRRSDLETAMRKATSSEARFRQLLVATSEGIVIHRNGEILEVSDNAARLLRTSAASMRGRRLEDYIERCSGYSMADAEAAKQLRMREGIARTSDSREIPIEFETRSIEFEGRGAEVLSFRDATPHKKLLEAIADQQAWERAILDCALDCIISMDSMGNVVAWNRAAEKTFGWHRDEVVGKALRDLIIPPVYRDAFDAELAEYGSSGTSRVIGKELEGAALRRDGSEFPVEFGISATHGTSTVVITAYLRDVTERKDAERELAKARDQAIRASTVKSEFLATMSHEIRTPMNGVLGMTALLLATDLAAVQRRHALAIEHSAKALLAIINDILDFSKIEAGRIELERTTFDIHQLVAEVGELLGEKAYSKGISLTCEIADDVPSAVVGDPLRVRQVVTNLVDNAIKYTHEGDVGLNVMLACDASDENLVLLFEVRDTGPGVTPEVQARLFTPFVQGDASMTRRHGGTGLGLAICRRLVELMGGEIGIESRMGEGSTFWFTVQLEKGVSRAASAQDRLAGRRVLLVSDQERSAGIVAGYVRSWAMACEAVASASDALAALDAGAASGKPWDVVLVDHALEGNSGLEFARTVRSDARHIRVPVVLITALSGLCTSDVTESALVDDLITKPVSKSQLFDSLLQATLHGRRPEREPAIGARPESGARSPSPCEAGVRGARRILVAEDNPINQEVASLMLEHLGYETRVVTNGVEALAALDEEPFDMVLMDCQMPEMDGFTAASRIRARDDTSRSLPIIAMTANAMKGDKERCLAAGMDDYIAKPIDPKELERTVARWQDGARRKAPAPVGERHETDTQTPEPGAGKEVDEVFEVLKRHLGATAGILASLRGAVAGDEHEETRRICTLLQSRSEEIGAWRMAELARGVAMVDPSAAEPALAALEQEFETLRADLGCADCDSEAAPANA